MDLKTLYKESLVKHRYPVRLPPSLTASASGFYAAYSCTCVLLLGPASEVTLSVSLLISSLRVSFMNSS